MQAARHHLSEAFPGALIYVGRPSQFAQQEDARLVGCKAVLDGATGAYARWPLTPAKDIRDPVYLEPNKDTIRAVVVRLKLKDVYAPKLKLMLWQEGETSAHWGRTGEAMLLRAGRYRVRPGVAFPWVAKHFESVFVEVKKSDPVVSERTIRIDGAYRTVVFEPEWEGDTFDGFIHISLSPDKETSYSVLNWIPSRGPIRVLHPVRSGRFRVDGGNLFEQASGSYEVTPGPQPLRIAINLKRKLSKK